MSYNRLYSTDPDPLICLSDALLNKCLSNLYLYMKNKLHVSRTNVVNSYPQHIPFPFAGDTLADDRWHYTANCHTDSSYSGIPLFPIHLESIC